VGAKSREVEGEKEWEVVVEGEEEEGWVAVLEVGRRVGVVVVVAEERVPMEDRRGVWF